MQRLLKFKHYFQLLKLFIYCIVFKDFIEIYLFLKMKDISRTKFKKQCTLHCLNLELRLSYRTDMTRHEDSYQNDKPYVAS